MALARWLSMEKQLNQFMLQKIVLLKKRSLVLIGDPDDLEKVGIDIPASAHKLASRFWPGPLTILVPKRADLPESVSATSTVGVRVPDHDSRSRPSARRRAHGCHLREYFRQTESGHC